MNADLLILYYIIGTVMGIMISYFLLRWIFAINKRINQNKSIINLLTILAMRQGATEDEINSATNN